MKKISLLDCTLRDGGYVNNWSFTAVQICSTVNHLTNAGIDYVEVGYLTSILGSVGGSQFLNVESASQYLPKERKDTNFVIMADVSQFDNETLCHRSPETVDGIRVVFYKRQIEQAFAFCDKIVEQGYELYLQPMVTMDYSLQEFSALVQRFSNKYKLHAISIVDSFGCMNLPDIHSYIKVLDNCVDKEIKIGFHGHDNMQLTQINANSLFEYPSDREFIVDSTVSGIGRGAGNLCTEIIANYYNSQYNGNYDLSEILTVASEVTEPISRHYQWGYSPYLMITAMHRAHPNFVTYLLKSHDVSVDDFSRYIRMVPDEMLTKCTRAYVEELYEDFLRQKQRGI